MAKKGRGRRSGVRKLRCSETLALGALGSGSMVVGDFDSVVDDTTFLLSIEAVWSMGEHQADAGPIAIGVAHSDYSSGEIGEWFAATGGWDRGDVVAQEIRKRKIRQVGTFSGIAKQETLNDGKAVKTPLKFNIQDGQTLQIWALNQDTTVLTTGTLVNCDGSVWAKSSK